MLPAPGQVGFDVGERVGARDARGTELAGGQRAHAGHRHHRQVRRGRGGRTGHPGRGLTVQRLLVERPLSGDDQARARQVIGEREQVQHQLDARPLGGAQEPQCREAQPARRARAWLVPADEAERLLGHVRPACEAFLEGRHILRGGAFLRRVDRGGAARPEQRVVHVGGRDHLGAGQVPEPGRVDVVQPGQRRPARGEFGPRRVKQPAAQRGDQARAAVGAGHAAQAEHDPLRAHPDRGQDELADAAAGRGQRGERPAGQPGQPAGLRGLDDGGPVEQGERGGRRPAGRPADLEFDAAVPRGLGRVDGTVAAVGHRDLDRRQPRAGPAEPGRHVRGHLGGGERSLELVRSDHHMAHWAMRSRARRLVM